MTDINKGLENRKRCLQCKYYGCNMCPLLANADVFKIDKCILEYDVIKSIRPGTLDHFLFRRNAIEYLSYLGWRDKENYPKIGEKVITLTSGFSSVYPGKFLVVVSEDSHQLFLEDVNKLPGAHQYCVLKEVWYDKLFKIEE